MGTNERARSFEREAIPHFDAVYRFALRLTGSAADAEDLVQETYLRGFRCWHRYTPGTRAKSWLFTICRNAFLRQRARETRRSELAAVEIDPRVEDHRAALGSATAPPLPDSLVAPRILSRIQKLPPEFRTAVLLCDLHSLAYADAARHLGVPVGTLKSRLHRARRILQKQLVTAAADHGLAAH
ncbi:MAG TPA: sigma-70 family RNA polymerase sigma factor [Longimicrobiales bacterium]